MFWSRPITIERFVEGLCIAVSRGKRRQGFSLPQGVVDHTVELPNLSSCVAQRYEARGSALEVDELEERGEAKSTLPAIRTMVPTFRYPRYHHENMLEPRSSVKITLTKACLEAQKRSQLCHFVVELETNFQAFAQTANHVLALPKCRTAASTSFSLATRPMPPQCSPEISRMFWQTCACLHSKKNT